MEDKGHGTPLVGAIIGTVGAVVAIVVAIFAFFVFILPMVEEAKENLPEGSTEAAMLDVLPIVFMVTIIIGVVVVILQSRGTEKKEEEEEPVDALTREGAYGFRPSKSLRERVRVEEQRR